jgi:hypothetical protein
MARRRHPWSAGIAAEHQAQQLGVADGEGQAVGGQLAGQRAQVLAGRQLQVVAARRDEIGSQQRRAGGPEQAQERAQVDPHQRLLQRREPSLALEQRLERPRTSG